MQSKTLITLLFTGICVFLLILASCSSKDKTRPTATISQPGNSPASVQPLDLDDHESYEKILKEDSLNTDARLKLAAFYYLKKDYNKALYHFLLVHSIDKNNMAALFNLGNIYYDLQQDEDAISYYEMFLEKEKTNYNVRCDLATCYIRLNNYVKAISLLRENIKASSLHLQSHYNLSFALRQTGKIAEADEEMKIYEKLKSQQP